MSATFYLLWYALATLTFILTWIFSKKIRSTYVRLGIRTFAFAFCFTTVPLMGQDGGLIVPIAMYYMSRSNWFEAAGVASFVIIITWLILFALVILIRLLYEKIRRA